MRLCLAFLLSILLAGAPQANTIVEALKRPIDGTIFVYSSSPHSLHATTAPFLAVAAVLQEIKKHSWLANRSQKTVMISRRGSEFRIHIFPGDAIDFQNMLNGTNTGGSGTFDGNSIRAVVDATSFEIKKLDICYGECDMRIPRSDK